MFDNNAQRIFFDRFLTVLDEMILELRNGNFTLDQIVEFYSSIHILENLTLLRRYNYYISVTETDVGREDPEEEEEE
jgi:hypothetical protein